MASRDRDGQIDSIRQAAPTRSPKLGDGENETVPRGHPHMRSIRESATRPQLCKLLEDTDGEQWRVVRTVEMVGDGANGIVIKIPGV